MFKVGFLKSTGSTSVGPNNPSNVYQLQADPSDTVWTNPTNIFTADNIYTTASFSATSNQGYLLQVYGYNFSIPGTATIAGVEVKVLMRNTVGLCYLDSIYLYWNALITLAAPNLLATKSPGTIMPTTNTTFTYGGPTDKWGSTSLTPAVVNNTFFGVFLQVIGDSSTLPQVDNVNIKIYYTS